MKIPKTIPGSAGYITTSHARNHVVICSSKGAQIWNLNPLSKGHRIEGDNVKRALFSRDGKVFVLLGVDDKAASYAVSLDGKLVALESESTGSQVASISPNGRFVACSGCDKNFQTIDLFRTDQTSSRSIPIYTRSRRLMGNETYPVAFYLPDVPRRVLVEWEHGRLEMMDAVTRTTDWGCSVPGLKKFGLSASGDRIVTFDASGRVRIHDTTKGRFSRRTIPLAEEGEAIDVGKVKFLGDERHFVVEVGDQFWFINAESGKKASVVTSTVGGRGGTWGVTRDGKTICVIRSSIATYPTHLQLNIPSSTRDANGVLFARLHDPAKRKDQSIIVSRQTGETIRPVDWTYVDRNVYRYTIVSSDDGVYCATHGRLPRSDDEGIEVRSISDGEQVLTVPLRETKPYHLYFEDDNSGMWIATDEAIQRLDFDRKIIANFVETADGRGEWVEPNYKTDKSPQPLAEAYSQTIDFRCFAQSASGWIATGHFRGFINIWSKKDRLRYAVIRAQSEYIDSLDISNDGKYLVYICNDRKEAHIVDLSQILPLEPPEPAKEAKDLDLSF